MSNLEQDTATSIKDDFNTLAKAFLDVMEGNDNYVLEAYNILERLGLVDELGFETGEYL